MRFRHRGPYSRSAAALTAFAWMALAGAIHFPTRVAADDDVHAIKTLIGRTWDKPEAKVEIDPVVVAERFAVASWTQGANGGRALLRRDRDVWSVLLCSGDQIREAHALEQGGVPAGTAAKLAALLEEAESRVAPERRAKFSLFGETVTVGHEPHGPHDQHSKHND